MIFLGDLTHQSHFHPTVQWLIISRIWNDGRDWQLLAFIGRTGVKVKGLEKGPCLVFSARKALLDEAGHESM